jgi:hypothetical protein
MSELLWFAWDVVLACAAYYVGLYRSRVVYVTPFYFEETGGAGGGGVCTSWSMAGGGGSAGLTEGLRTESTPT